MAVYITPFNRVSRRAWSRPYRRVEQAEQETVACDVLVPVSVRAEEDAFVINALLPGVKAEELSIQVLNETVTLQGEIKTEQDEQEGYLLREIPAGRFYRVLRLPDALDINKAEADLVDGVLTLRVPKAEVARPKTIKVINKN